MRRGTISSGVSPIIQGNESAMKSMQRLARTIVNFTPATHFILANEEMGFFIGMEFGLTMTTTNQEIIPTRIVGR